MGITPSHPEREVLLKPAVVLDQREVREVLGNLSDALYQHAAYQREERKREQRKEDRHVCSRRDPHRHESRWRARMQEEELRRLRRAVEEDLPRKFQGLAADLEPRRERFERAREPIYAPYAERCAPGPAPYQINFGNPPWSRQEAHARVPAYERREYERPDTLGFQRLAGFQGPQDRYQGHQGPSYQAGGGPRGRRRQRSWDRMAPDDDDDDDLFNRAYQPNAAYGPGPGGGGRNSMGMRFGRQRQARRAPNANGAGDDSGAGDENAFDQTPQQHGGARRAADRPRRGPRAAAGREPGDPPAYEDADAWAAANEHNEAHRAAAERGMEEEEEEQEGEDDADPGEEERANGGSSRGGRRRDAFTAWFDGHG